MNNLKSGTLYDPEIWEKITKHQKKNLLEQVLDIRKFEINLYWERAKYFWAFNLFAFSGYGTVYLKARDNPGRADLVEVLVMLACVGIIVSLAWVLVNKGSKYWQENWENHLDLIEDDVLGPLYKTVFDCPREPSWRFLIASGKYSVSKINLLISWFALFLWIVLLLSMLGIPHCDIGYTGRCWLIVGTMIIFCCILLSSGGTGSGQKTITPRRRRTFFS